MLTLFWEMFVLTSNPHVFICHRSLAKQKGAVSQKRIPWRSLNQKINYMHMCVADMLPRKTKCPRYTGALQMNPKLKRNTGDRFQGVDRRILTLRPPAKQILLKIKTYQHPHPTVIPTKKKQNAILYYWSGLFVEHSLNLCVSFLFLCFFSREGIGMDGGLPFLGARQVE